MTAPIIHRAYELWEWAGKPDGRDEEFYHPAEKELNEGVPVRRNRNRMTLLKSPQVIARNERPTKSDCRIERDLVVARVIRHGGSPACVEID
jgi:hypothetical protein